MFQNTSHREINFFSKQLYFQSRINLIEIRAAIWSWYFITKRLFFRTRSCLEQLLLSNNYFLVTNTFSDQLLLEDQDSYSFGGATFSELIIIQNMYIFEVAGSSKQVLFLKNLFLYFLRRVNFFEKLFLHK